MLGSEKPDGFHRSTVGPRPAAKGWQPAGPYRWHQAAISKVNSSGPVYVSPLLGSPPNAARQPLPTGVGHCPQCHPQLEAALRERGGDGGHGVRGHPVAGGRVTWRLLRGGCPPRIASTPDCSCTHARVRHAFPSCGTDGAWRLRRSSPSRSALSTAHRVHLRDQLGVGFAWTRLMAGILLGRIRDESQEFRPRT